MLVLVLILLLLPFPFTFPNTFPLEARSKTRPKAAKSAPEYASSPLPIGHSSPTDQSHCRWNSWKSCGKRLPT